MRLSPLLGKHIVAVVHSQCAESTGPAEQLFLVFDDGTNYEFYGNAIGAGGLRNGDRASVIDLLQDRTCMITQASI